MLTFSTIQIYFGEPNPSTLRPLPGNEQYGYASLCSLQSQGGPRTIFPFGAPNLSKSNLEISTRQPPGLVSQLFVQNPCTRGSPKPPQCCCISGISGISSVHPAIATCTACYRNMEVRYGEGDHDATSSGALANLNHKNHDSSIL